MASSGLRRITRRIYRRTFYRNEAEVANSGKAKIYRLLGHSILREFSAKGLPLEISPAALTARREGLKPGLRTGDPELRQIGECPILWASVPPAL